MKVFDEARMKKSLILFWLSVLACVSALLVALCAVLLIWRPDLLAEVQLRTCWPVIVIWRSGLPGERRHVRGRPVIRKEKVDEPEIIYVTNGDASNRRTAA